jgi:hypothetical protein
MSADMNVGASSGNTSVIVNEWEAEAFLGYIFDEPLNSLRRVNIHDLEKDPKVDPRSRGKGCTSIKQAVASAKYRAEHERNVFFCVAYQRDERQKVNEETKQSYMIAWRAVPNIVSIPVYFMEIDCKAKYYGGRDETWAAFEAFREGTGLSPPSVVVWSGAGFHVYWKIAPSIAHAGWQRNADRLMAAINREGFQCDKKRETDGISLLRVPGTFNWKPGYAPGGELYDPKYGYPRRVKLLRLDGQEYAPAANLPRL